MLSGPWPGPSGEGEVLAAASAGLGRSDRIRSSKDFQRLARGGRRRASRHFVVVIGCGWLPDRTRLGLAVGRKVGNAVQRNRLKRRLREWFRRHRESLPLGTDVVVIARKGAAALDSEAIERELEGLLS